MTPTLPLFHFDGVPFVATPYRPGTYIREDVFWRQFAITCQGRFEYLEDDPAYGTFWLPGTLNVGQCGLIEEAMTLIASLLWQDRIDPGGDTDALDFVPELFIVRDRFDRLMLAGEAMSAHIKWCQPVASDQEAERVAKLTFELYDEASLEAGWDNFSTAERLSLRARVLEGRLVDRSWRAHTRDAIRNASA
ncbi:hypothetical protein [Thauera sinica]|uniref:Uncharacterized protein n=1 Tax=Thauera sinica TaxID=2665146 RepID=A0ABW1AXX8_9RHOO|nr:hypothetical protein [Thauera sp. K11]ATE62399.1 hypothetical protein CCZ27_01035 [Thauera sp. K11]